jgi:protein-S-isoprenylcysteine O-methyltransferase Ste14
MNWPVAKAIFVLPGTGVVLIPAVLLWISQTTRFAADLSGPRQIPFWFGLCIAVLGLILQIWTISLFAKRGRGTLAPWEPPKRLVVEGPYRHVSPPHSTGGSPRISVLAYRSVDGHFFHNQCHLLSPCGGKKS